MSIASAFRRTPALRWAVALSLLAVVALFLDLGRVSEELSRLPVALLVPVLILTVLQVCLSAWRWRYTAGCLGMNLALNQAVREYYLASFLNQVMPGGVLGDVGRAWRHGTATGQPMASAHAVVIERLSGQLVLALCVLFAIGALILSESVRVDPDVFVWWVPALVLLAFTGVRALVGLESRLGRYLHQLRGDLGRSLLSWPALPIQMATSMALLCSYLAVFLLLAYGAGYLESPGAVPLTAALCSLLLLSMVVPITVAGWGVREGAAAVLWPLAGLPAEQGVALSVGYGVMVFVSTLPGVLVLFTRQALPEPSGPGSLRKNRDQTTYRCPD